VLQALKRLKFFKTLGFHAANRNLGGTLVFNVYFKRRNSPSLLWLKPPGSIVVYPMEGQF
jgi:hypothetical protein